MSDPIMRYVASTRGGRGPLVAMQQDLDKQIVKRNAAMPVEYGIKDGELQTVLKVGMEKFIRAMELQGLTVIPLPQGNPVVVKDAKGRYYGTYSVTESLMAAPPDALIDEKTGGAGPSTQKEPRSLEDANGWIDYHFIGVFWAPQVSIEIAVARDKLLAQERAAKNPRQWGAGTATPTRPSFA